MQRDCDVKRIINIIRDYFINGIRDDFIDTSKVLRICLAEGLRDDLSLDAISHFIRSEGIRQGQRFYFFSAEVVAYLRCFLAEILKTNAIVYYEAFYREHVDFFCQLRIFSAEVLRQVLRTISDNCFHSKDFFSSSKRTSLDGVIADIFATTTAGALSLEELGKRLPYVPTAEILAVLTDSKKYLSTLAGEYLPASRIQFDLDEIRCAKRQIFLCLEEKGYATLDDYDLSSNRALNADLSTKDVLHAIYARFFSASFVRRGNRLCAKHACADKNFFEVTTKHLRTFVAKQEQLSERRLVELAHDFGVTVDVASHVVCRYMLRAERDLFVRSSLIRFDVAGVDAALEPFVRGRIIPLRGVTSFTGFPSVGGYSWNLYLLESFLRRYSRKYFFASPACNATCNSSNVGAIYPRSMRFETYPDVQAAVIAQENVPLEKAAVEKFLIDGGFRVRRLERSSAKIIARVREIKTRRDYV